MNEEEIGIQRLGDLMKSFTPNKIVVLSRGQWLRKFYSRLYVGWNNYMPEPLTLKYLAIRMRNVDDLEMPVLWKLCEESQSFDKFFWWRIKKYPAKKKEKKLKQGTLI